MKRTLTIGLSVFVAATCGCRKPSAASAAAAVPVRVAQAEHLQVGNTLQYSASVVPNDQVDLSFRSGGYVASIHQVRGADGRVRPIDVGDYVPAGTVLAYVRPSDYQDQIREAEANVAKAQASAQAAKLSFQRMSTLYATASATKPDYDDAESQFESTAASVKSTEAQLALAHTQLADSIIRAPKGGWITARNISVGSLVGGSVTAFSLIDTHLVHVSFGVPDTELQLLRLGQELQVHADAAGDYSGRVTSISPSADSKTRIYTVEVTLPNTNNLLKAGMIATLTLQETTPKDVTVIPLGAVLRSSQDSHTFTVMVPEAASGGYVAHARVVQLGDAYGDKVAVTSGLQPGDQVISSGAGLVHDGEALQIIP